MPHFKFISESGDGMGIALRILEEGNEVSIWIKDDEAHSVGDGLVPKVGLVYDLLSEVREDDVFVFDTSGHGLLAEYLSSRGIKLLGASAVADKLEHDRAFGTGVMEDAGILVPASHNFTNFDKAIEFAKEAEERLVYKPAKQLGEQTMSHVSYDNEDMVKLLENIKKEVNLAEPEFVLQEFVEGVALSSEAWFDGIRFLPMFNHTLERKESMNDNLGPSGGCTGNVVWACPGCHICDGGIKKMERFLRKERYVGMVDLNAIVTEKGEVYGLEWTPRFGYDATPTLLYELVDGDIGQLFADIARGQYGSATPPLRQETFASAVRLTIPPWPSEKFHADEGVPIQGVDEDALRHTYLYNVKSVENELVSAGAWGILLLFLGRGATLGRSFSKPYEFAKEARIPNKQYRTDLLAQFREDMEKIALHVESEVA